MGSSLEASSQYAFSFAPRCSGCRPARHAGSAGSKPGVMAGHSRDSAANEDEVARCITVSSSGDLTSVATAADRPSGPAALIRPAAPSTGGADIERWQRGHRIACALGLSSRGARLRRHRGGTDRRRPARRRRHNHHRNRGTSARPRVHWIPDRACRRARPAGRPRRRRRTRMPDVPHASRPRRRARCC